MAEWEYGPNAPEAAKLWSRRLFKQSITKTIAWKLANISAAIDGEENIVQILEDTQVQKAGGTITYDLVAKLSGLGVLGDNPLAGQEESLTTYTTTITINQLRHSVLVKGAMSQQRVPFQMRKTATGRLADWFAERDNLGTINQATGNTGGFSILTLPDGSTVQINTTNTAITGLVAPVAPDAAHMVFGGTKTSEGTLASGDSATLSMILQVIYIADTNVFPIKPISLDGIDIRGALLLHPLQVKSLKNSFSAGAWGEIQLSAMKGGEITGNPIFRGSVGMYEGVVIHSDAQVPYGNRAGSGNDTTTLNPGRNCLGTANVARGVFMGGQALAMAMGRAYDSPGKIKWFEEVLDGGNQLRVSCGKMYGIQKNTFNSQDFATVTFSTFEL